VDRSPHNRNRAADGEAERRVGTPMLTAISARPFEFSYQKALPAVTEEKVRARGIERPPARRRASGESIVAREPRESDFDRHPD
jgi:hypothetical protein